MHLVQDENGNLLPTAMDILTEKGIPTATKDAAEPHARKAADRSAAMVRKAIRWRLCWIIC